ncbi:unnamed protein product [Tilletia caries]|nr:hypothetical protein CF336_g2706 [Tilletia laevis]CAD6884746.1 unnamed protein product [Tilletia caries]
MDIYTRFDLPPPPPPSIFSRDHGPGRARFPEFSSVDEVRLFIFRIVVWPDTKDAYVTLPIQVAYLLLLGGYGSYVILRKIADQSWWLFRVCPRRNGNVIIPHTHNTWTLIIGFYGMLLCMLYLAIFAYYIKDEPLAHRGLIFTLLWTPIPFASYYQAWAISYADIDGRAASFASGGSNLAASHRKRKQVPAWLVNWTWALLPFISIGSVLNTALLSDQQWETARHGWYQWRSTYANATEISREMLLDAQDIWTSELRGAHFYTIGNIIWIVNLVGGGTLHVTLAGLLIFRLRRHLQTQRVLHDSVLSPTKAQNPSRLELGNPNSELNHNRSALSGNEGSLPLSPSTPSSSWSREENRPNGPTAVSPSADAGSSQRKAGPAQIFSRLFNKTECNTDATKRFFPPVKPSKIVTTVPTRRAEKVLFYFIIQSLTVCTAAAIFLFILLYFTIGCVPMLEAGRPDILHNVAWHAIMVNTFLCGTATIISSTHTYFEDTFAALMNGELPASILAGNALTRPRVQQPSLQEHGRTRSSPTAFTQGTATPDSGSVNPSTVTRELLQLAEK